MTCLTNGWETTQNPKVKVPMLKTGKIGKKIVVLILQVELSVMRTSFRAQQPP